VIKATCRLVEAHVAAAKGNDKAAAGPSTTTTTTTTTTVDEPSQSLVGFVWTACDAAKECPLSNQENAVSRLRQNCTIIGDATAELKDVVTAAENGSSGDGGGGGGGGGSGDDSGGEGFGDDFGDDEDLTPEEMACVRPTSELLETVHQLMAAVLGVCESAADADPAEEATEGAAEVGGGDLAIDAFDVQFDDIVRASDTMQRVVDDLAFCMEAPVDSAEAQSHAAALAKQMGMFSKMAKKTLKIAEKGDTPVHKAGQRYIGLQLQLGQALKVLAESQ
jgi:hypothetical protein